jgi:GNAT superfamily N-acetyltransferase
VRQEAEGGRKGRQDLDRGHEAGWAPLSSGLDPVAADFLADCPALGTTETAAMAIASLRDDPDGEVYGWVDGDALIAVYGLRKAGLSFELPWLAVAPSWRGQRYGRSALVDALRRCGANQ